MPMLSTAIPKCRKKTKDNGPQAVVTLSGRDHYLGPYGSKASKLLYDRLTIEWLASGRKTSQADEVATIAELINAYRKWAYGYYRHADGSQTGTAGHTPI